MTTSPSALQEVAPYLAELTAKVVFGDVWERPGLSKRDRSLITLASVIVLYRTEQIRYHVRLAMTNGVTKEEIGEIITHLAFYGGMPVAVNAAQVAREVYQAS